MELDAALMPSSVAPVNGTPPARAPGSAWTTNGAMLQPPAACCQLHLLHMSGPWAWTHAAALSTHLADALLHAAKGLDLGGEEAKEVEKYQALAEDAAGGELRVFKEGDDVDAVHWWVRAGVAGRLIAEW